MKKKSSLFFVLLFFCYSALANANSIDVDTSWRSADPCEKWLEWSTGDDSLILSPLASGRASHDLSPAEIIFLSAKENGANPILILAILEDQQKLNSIPATPGIFEQRLFWAMGFAIDEDGNTPYGGFFPQLVAASFQMKLAFQRNMSFGDFYANYFTGGEYVNGITIIYSWYVKEFSLLTGVSHDTSLNSPDVFTDFSGLEMDSRKIQFFLKKIGSALAYRGLFRQRPIDDSIDYQNPPCE